MTRFHRMVLLALALFSFTGFCSFGLPQQPNGTSPGTQNGDNHLIDVQSASGKVTGLRRHRFSIEIQQVKAPGDGSHQENRTSSMIFRIDSSTKIEGKLGVGTNADVLYRQAKGKNVAVTVHVTAIS